MLDGLPNDTTHQPTLPEHPAGLAVAPGGCGEAIKGFSRCPAPPRKLFRFPFPLPGGGVRN